MAGLKFLDLFSGIGGFRLGMEGSGHECVGYVEWDKYARQAYQAMHNTEGEWTSHDITKVTDDDIRQLKGRVDCITGGFPCQSFSIAGKRGGFQDTRGTLFFEIARFAKQIQPRFLLLENVKGLLSHSGGNTFLAILSTLDELGYDVEWENCNSKNFGVPQNRERVFIVGHSRRFPRREIFPLGGENKNALKQVIEGMQGCRVYDRDGLSTALTGDSGGFGGKTGLYLEPFILHNIYGGFKEDNPRTFDTCPTLRTSAGGGHIPSVAVIKNHGKLKECEHANCIDANYHKGLDNHGQRTGVKDGYRIRKLTPKECFRLQGFPDEYFQRAKDEGISDTQLYKMAGNSVSVPVVEAIAQRLKGGEII